MKKTVFFKNVMQGSVDIDVRPDMDEEDIKYAAGHAVLSGEANYDANTDIVVTSVDDKPLSSKGASYIHADLDSIIKYFVDNNISMRKVVEAFPNVIATKLWMEDDVRNQANDMDIPEEIAEMILPEAINNIDTDALEDRADDFEWNVIGDGIKEAVENYALTATNIEWDVDVDDMDFSNVSDEFIAKEIGITIEEYSKLDDDDRYDKVMSYYQNKPDKIESFLGLPKSLELPEGIYTNYDIEKFLEERTNFCFKGYKLTAEKL